jgi:CHAT domain-containing protein/tetratricopeptide (TPR) repeat protein
MVRFTASLLVVATLAGPISAVAAERVPERPDVISLGRGSTGEPCTATRDWRDPAVPDPFSRAYVITCQSVTASRPVGTVRIVRDTPAGLRPIDTVLRCGADRAVTINDLSARARRCWDSALSTEVVRIDVVRGRARIVADAAPAVSAALEEAVAILSGAKGVSADAGRTVTATIDVAALAPLTTGPDVAATPAAPATATAGAQPHDGVTVPAQAVAAADAGAFDAAEALAQGISFNHKGLHVEASRVLNDALSRLPTGTPAVTRAELLLEAGLADSNISFPTSAANHFAQADAVMTASPETRTPFLQHKHDAYLALDALNRHQYRDALALLDRLSRASVAADQPLRDPATLRLLNQPRAPAGSAVRSVALPDTADLSRLVLDAEVNWARSVALLSLGEEKAALTAINAAANAYRPLETERIDQAQILWLGGRIERQRARLLVRAGRIGDALDSFDRAIDDLRRGAIATAGTGNEPAIADAEFERAAVFARSGARHEAVRRSYADAVDAVLASDGNAPVLAGGFEDYLDLLVAEAASGVKPDTYERFFRAVQATGEPAVARQLSQLQTVVSADPGVATLVRDRAGLEREITRLRYAIAAGPAKGGASTTDMEHARTVAEQRLLTVDAQLARNPRFRSVDEQPATLAELRRSLRPGEAYLKLTQTQRRIYGLYVTADRTYIYAIASDVASRRVIDQLAQDVRASIDGTLDQGTLVPFDDAKAYALFRLITGPAAAAVAATPTLIVDPAGPLERLPIGVLVTQYDAGHARPSPFDFSQTAFLASKTTVSTALSPRSFLVARALPGSRAHQPFLGLGQHQPPPEVASTDRARMVQIGYGCEVSYGDLATLARRFEPINAAELTIAADALGMPGAPRIIGAAFTDTGVEQRGDLGDYEVLHFATHGLQEGQWGCAKSPPALVTSLGNSGSDGLLSFSEIANLRLDANLVVLSACDTSSGVNGEALARLSGQEEAGSTLEGLVRAFLTANARSVLATYWQVSAERDNQEFIRSFYASARTKPIGAALQDAQRDLIRQPAYSHPFYWAPYFLVGDGTKPMLTAAAPRLAQR